jgi:hypothetical protein
MRNAPVTPDGRGVLFQRIIGTTLAIAAPHSAQTNLKSALALNFLISSGKCSLCRGGNAANWMGH